MAKKRLTKKQVRALLRSFSRSGYSAIKAGSCRVVNNRRTKICRDSRGYWLAESPAQRAKAAGASRSRRLSPYYAG